MDLGEQRRWYVDLELEVASVAGDQTVAHLDERAEPVVRRVSGVLAPFDGFPLNLGIEKAIAIK